MGEELVQVFEDGKDLYSCLEFDFSVIFVYKQKKINNMVVVEIIYKLVPLLSRELQLNFALKV